MVQARMAGVTTLAESGTWGSAFGPNRGLHHGHGRCKLCRATERRSPGLVVDPAAWHLAGHRLPGDAHIPAWMEGKSPGPEGQPRWYVCQEGACQLAVDTAEQAWNLCPLS